MEQITLGDSQIQTSHTNADWLRVLEEYDVRFAVLDPSRDANWVTLLRRRPEWQVDSEDQEAVIFARTTTSEGL